MEPANANILIVDDEVGITELYGEVLEQSGYICHTASGGEAALEILAANRIELALLDIAMPGMDGLTLFNHMLERHSDSAVIFITAMDVLNVAVGNLKQGAYDYLVKPVSLERLRQCVSEVLGRRKTMLEQKQKLGLFDQKGRELTALNGLFQRHLDERFAVVDAYEAVMEGLSRIGQEIDSLHEFAKSLPLREGRLGDEVEADVREAPR